MALPFIILGVAAGAAAFGGKKLTMDIKKSQKQRISSKKQKSVTRSIKENLSRLKLRHHQN